ncbi:MAG: MurR/RpiR family transcriptional regulator [Phyllobacterium sp.]
MPAEKPKPQVPPRDFESLRSFIIEKRESMPKRLTQVGAYALQSPDEIAFGTAASIASAADVQPSTLVRFAHHLGYDGFSDLQTVFRERLRGRTSSYEERLRAIESEQHNESDETVLLHGFMTAAARSVQTLAESIDTAAFQRAISILARADTIFLVAKRRSYPLIAHMAYAFGKLKIRIHVIDSPNGIDNELVEMAGPNDAAIAVSFSPYAAESVNHAQTMIANGVPLVAITDSAFSPLVAGAAEWLEVAEADYTGFRSLSASIALTMAIPVAVAEQRRKTASKMTRKQA